jgi:soluble lytic murein transglycosylase-like protein
LLVGSVIFGATPTASAEPIRTASLPPDSEIVRETEVPSVLSAADAIRYRAIFRAQAAGDWAAADAEIDRLQDRVLLGHVLADRYLHRKYRAKYAELFDWLTAYADHPEAPAIHALALHRRVKGSAAPPKPVGSPVPLNGTQDRPADLRPSLRASTKELSPADRQRATELKAELRRLARNAPDLAEHMLRGAEAQALLDDSEYDDVRADIADSYLFAGEDQKALILSATARTAAYRPLAHWNGGLAAWRLGKLSEARSHFEALARTPGISEWNVSAAAFWAARVHLRNRHPQLVNYWLGIAAQQPRTFYGLLARRMLGQDVYFNFEAETLNGVEHQVLSNTRQGRRAIALVQVGETARAEMELRYLANEATPAMLPALVALADGGNMPALSLQLAKMLSELDGRRHDHALYPVPRWEPHGGFSIDKALLFALMRQESEFLPRAESQAGAIGLMQLMPDTARPLVERAGFVLKPRERLAEKLREPETNLTLAQHYVAHLMKHEKIGRNLILVAAAYNGGPGNLLKWRARDEYRKDPLLFLESLPSRETRVFVTRVLTNYWIYRVRFGQKTPDLDRLAAGEWPLYVALDTPPDRTTRNAAAR